MSRVVEPVDSVLRSTGELSNGAGKLTTGSSTATTAFAGLPPTLQSMRDVLGQAKAATRDLRGVQLAMRIREELSGIVFGITMFALAGSAVLSIEQVGITVGVGLLLDTRPSGLS